MKSVNKNMDSVNTCMYPSNELCITLFLSQLLYFHLLFVKKNKKAKFCEKLIIQKQARTETDNNAAHMNYSYMMESCVKLAKMHHGKHLKEYLR